MSDFEDFDEDDRKGSLTILPGSGQDFDVKRPLPAGYELDSTGQIVAIPEAMIPHDGNAPMVALGDRPELWPMFLETYARTGRMTAACASVGTSKPTAMRCAASHPDFAKALAAAHDSYVGKIHAEYQRRGFAGVTKPVYQKGVLVGTVQEYNDRFLEVELRRVSAEFRELLAPPKVTGQTNVTVNATSNTAVQNVHNAATAIGALAADQHQALRTLDPRTMTAQQRAALRVLLTTGTEPESAADAPGTATGQPRALCAAQGGQADGPGAGVLDVEAHDSGHAATATGVAPEGPSVPGVGTKP
jgi:hypothetical protein